MTVEVVGHEPTRLVDDVVSGGVVDLDQGGPVVGPAHHEWLGVIPDVGDADQDELARAVTAISRGEAIFSPAIAERLIRYFDALPATASALAFPDRTRREREILHLIAQGHSNAAIAERLVLSLKTVQNHISTIFSKLQVADRAQAIVRAREAGLGERKPERPPRQAGNEHRI